MRHDGTDRFHSRRRAPWVAVFGPDGVGKSAVIARVQQKLASRFDGCRRFHFRPRVFRPQIDAAPTTAPHAQTPRGLVLSYLKLIYWLLDCWLGHLLQVLPALRNSQFVIFDRYLPDLLVDPVRYRLPASARNFAQRLVRLAPEPDLWILLDASAEQVQQRKQEVSPAESRRQREAYLQHFQLMPGAFLINADRSLEEVTREAAAIISGFNAGFNFRVPSFESVALQIPVQGAGSGGVKHAG